MLVCFIVPYNDCYNSVMQAIVDVIKKYPHRAIACVSIMFFVCVFYFTPLRTPAVMKITFLDVGQGDAVLVTGPNGNRLLYDAGPPTGAVLYALDKELSYFDRRIAFMVSSHPDVDHIGGFGAVLSRYTPLLYLDGHTHTSSADFAGLEEMLGAKRIERRTLTRGARLSLGSGVVVDVLNPVQDARKESLSTNDASVVLRIQYGSSTVLLTGDLELGEESRLVDAYGGALHTTVLKAGHHGSKSSSSEKFLQAVQPDYVVISAGKNNRYGHPSPAALDRMGRTRAQILETSQLGSIHFSCSPEACVYLRK